MLRRKSRQEGEKCSSFGYGPHNFPTVTENPANFSKQEIESKTHQIN